MRVYLQFFADYTEEQMLAVKAAVAQATGLPVTILDGGDRIDFNAVYAEVTGIVLVTETILCTPDQGLFAKIETAVKSVVRPDLFLVYDDNARHSAGSAAGEKAVAELGRRRRSLADRARPVAA